MVELQRLSHVGVVGLGDVLMRDDGLGPHVIEQLDLTYVFHPHVELLDLGTPGPTLGEYFVDLDAIILVDAIHRDTKPGTIEVLGRRAVLHGEGSPQLSLHDTELATAIQYAERYDGPKHVLLVGAVPEEVSLGVGLSTVVARAVPRVIEVVLKELRFLAVDVAPRSHKRPTRRMPVLVA